MAVFFEKSCQILITGLVLLGGRLGGRISKYYCGNKWMMYNKKC
jgi:hypothetical protein